MKAFIDKFVEYLRSVRNASPHTIANYGKDLEQFQTFLTPPGTTPPPSPRSSTSSFANTSVICTKRGCKKVPLRENWQRCVRSSNTV